MTRLSIFLTVGALGFVVQLSVLAALTSLAHWSWLPATLLAVEIAVLHNFFWHQRWTWRDRHAEARSAHASGERLLRFHLSNGIVSIAGNAAVMALLVETAGVPAIVANVVAVAVISIANFVIADRWVFSSRTVTVGRGFAAVGLVLMLPLSAAAEPPVETLSAWNRYVTGVEARIEGTRISDARGGSHEAIAADGESTQVPSGTISDWRGSVFIPHVTLDRLLHRLQHPGTPPPQDDVVSSRVIARQGESLQVAIRLVRRAIVTVSYDTEHRIEFRRVTPTVATARSVATHIEEVGGEDHGFLWRLHSYWRYEEADGGVRVELRSLTLSRRIPALVRPVAAPLVNAVARESMVRTLDALRRYLSTPFGRS
jgi:putative flippase GtrA